MASPQLARVIAHLKDVASRSNIASGDIVGARAILDDYAAVDDRVQQFDAQVKPIEVEGIPCEWIQAPGADPDRRLLYLHGGGWTAGSLDSHRPLSARISAATGCAVLAVDYRLAPENAFPAGLDDCIAAYQWLRANGPGGAGAATSLFIAGDSAGGNLTFCTMLACKQRGIPLPNAAVPLSAATDLTGSGETFQTRADVDPIIPPDPAALTMMEMIYCQGNAKLDDPLVSPLFGDLAGLPPLLIQVGDAEVLLSDSTRIAERAEAAGVAVTLEIWDDMPHVWQAFAGFLPEADEAIAHIGQFVRKHG